VSALTCYELGEWGASSTALASSRTLPHSNRTCQSSFAYSCSTSRSVGTDLSGSTLQRRWLVLLTDHYVTRRWLPTRRFIIAMRLSLAGSTTPRIKRISRTCASLRTRSMHSGRGLLQLASRSLLCVMAHCSAIMVSRSRSPATWAGWRCFIRVAGPRSCHLIVRPLIRPYNRTTGGRGILPLQSPNLRGKAEGIARLGGEAQ